MRLLTNPLLLLLALIITLVHAAPGGGGGVPKLKAPPLVPNENATWFCTHKYKVMYSHYKLRGSGWNKTEKEIRKRVEAAGMTTRWKFETVIGEDGKEGFESSVSCCSLVSFFLSELCCFSFWLRGR